MKEVKWVPIFPLNTTGNRRIFYEEKKKEIVLISRTYGRIKFGEELVYSWNNNFKLKTITLYLEFFAVNQKTIVAITITIFAALQHTHHIHTLDFESCFKKQANVAGCLVILSTQLKF